MTTQDPVWMTEAARERLVEELAELERAGETADQARMRELTALLRRTEVDRKPDDGLVEPGMTVTIRFEADGSTDTFLLGSRELVKLDPVVELEVYSPTSPLGAAIAGRYVGDSVSYASPGGEQQVTIVSAVPFG